MTYRIVLETRNTNDLHVKFVDGQSQDDAVLRCRRSDFRFNFGNADIIEVSVARNQSERRETCFAN